jgi:AI-2 transport protein TqsA
MANFSSTSRPAFYIRAALILHGIVLVLFILYIAKVILIPLFIAFLIAMLVFPVAKFFERLHLGRGISSGLAVILFIVFVTGLIVFFGMEISRFSKDVPHLQDRFLQMVQNIQDWISKKYNIDDDKQKAYINKSAGQLVSGMISSAGTTLLGIVELLVISIFCFVFTFFILYFRDLLMKFLLSLFKSVHAEKVRDVATKTKAIINSYVIGLFVEMFAIVLIAFPILAVFHIRYALLFATLAAVLNIIPYIGIYTATAIGMMVTFANGTGTQAIEVAAIFIFVHLIDANILLPRIVGGQVKMNPFVTLIAVFTGNFLWGIPGMFLFIPLTAIFRIISEAVNDLKPWAIVLGEEK